MHKLRGTVHCVNSCRHASWAIVSCLEASYVRATCTLWQLWLVVLRRFRPMLSWAMTIQPVLHSSASRWTVLESDALLSVMKLSGYYAVYYNNIIIINWFIKQHKVVTSEALASMCWGQTCTLQSNDNRKKEVFSLQDLKVVREPLLVMNEGSEFQTDGTELFYF